MKGNHYHIYLTLLILGIIFAIPCGFCEYTGRESASIFFGFLSAICLAFSFASGSFVFQESMENHRVWEKNMREFVGDEAFDKAKYG